MLAMGRKNDGDALSARQQQAGRKAMAPPPACLKEPYAYLLSGSGTAFVVWLALIMARKRGMAMAYFNRTRRACLIYQAARRDI